MTQHERELWSACAADCMEVAVAIALIVFWGWLACECIHLAEVCQ
jgi:hypothetical protein